MTLELTTSWVVRGGCETSAEIAKYRLKGILYWDRQKCRAWRWVQTERFSIKQRLILTGTHSWGLEGVVSRKRIYRWERRK